MKPFDSSFSLEESEQWFLDWAIERYQGRQQSALLEIASWAMQMHEAVPDEIAQTFALALSSWKSGDVRSLDEAFDLSRPKGWRQDAARRWQFAGAIYIEVKRLHEKDSMPIDDSIFERAGERWGIGKTAAAEMYYAVRDSLGKTSE